MLAPSRSAFAFCMQRHSRSLPQRQRCLHRVGWLSPFELVGFRLSHATAQPFAGPKATVVALRWLAFALLTRRHSRDQYASLSSHVDRFYSSESIWGHAHGTHLSRFENLTKNSHVGPELPSCHVAGCRGDPADRARAGTNQPGSTQGARGAQQAVGGSGSGRIMAEDNLSQGPSVPGRLAEGLPVHGAPMHVQLQAGHNSSEPGISSAAHAT